MGEDDRISETERQIEELAEGIKATGEEVIDTGLAMARVGRNSRPTSSSKIRAIRPGDPLPTGDLTGKFAALKA